MGDRYHSHLCRRLRDASIFAMAEDVTKHHSGDFSRFCVSEITTEVATIEGPGISLAIYYTHEIPERVVLVPRSMGISLQSPAVVKLEPSEPAHVEP